ncbi:hypothetical protein [Hungatella hathewayi]
MSEYMAFSFGRKDGTQISEEEFFLEHSDVVITENEKERLLQNLEVQSILILKYGRERGLNHFVFSEDNEDFFIKPLGEHGACLFFIELQRTMLLVYDMRVCVGN